MEVTNCATLAPALADRMLGADFVPAEGYGDPLRGMMALLRQAQAHGVRLLRGAEVRAIERTGTGWTVTTSQRRRHRRPGGQRDRSVGGRDRAAWWGWTCR